MQNISSQFVKKLYTLSCSPFPKRIQIKARECFTDYISVVLAGSRTYTDVNMKFVKENKMTGECHIFGFFPTVDLRTAVMINAFNAHVLELDDSHRIAMTHLGASIFSALVGVAEIYGCSIERILHAAVVGYEAAICLACAIQPSHKKRGFHVSGTCCTVGCAIGIASMLDYSEKEMANVLSASASAAAGLLAVISGDSEQKPYNVANAAVAGVNAALYGKYYKGATDILDDSRGFFKAMCDQYRTEKIFEKEYAIESIYQKLYAACRHCHAPMEAMLMLMKKHNFNSETIENIEVRTYDLAINGHDHTDIAGVSSAKQSIPYGVAAACLYQDCGIDAFTEEKVIDARLLNLTKKVTVVEDIQLTELVPEKRAAILQVKLNNGNQYNQRVDFPKGEPENPITKKEMAEKFFSLVKKAGITKNNSLKLFRFIQCADQESIYDLFKLI